MSERLDLFTDILIVVGGLIGLFFLIHFVVNYANAEVDYNSIKELENKITEAEDRYQVINNQIKKEKILIRDLKISLDSQTKLLKNTVEDSKTNWDSIPKIKQIEESIENLKTIITQKESNLKILENKRNEYFTNIEKLQIQYDKDFETYKEQNTFIPGNMTKLIGIVLSEGCIESLKNNQDSQCPDYRLLKQLDTSNQDFSGRFGVNDGFYSRGPEIYKNSHRSYDLDPTLRIIVDPPLDQRNRIKMITIENNFQTYFVPEIDNKLHNNTRTYHELRFVDDCRNAQISVFNWTKILPDTVHYMRTGCGVTGFNELVTEVRDDSPWNPLDSPGYLYRLWVDQMKALCKNKC